MGEAYEKKKSNEDKIEGGGIEKTMTNICFCQTWYLAQASAVFLTNTFPTAINSIKNISIKFIIMYSSLAQQIKIVKTNLV